MPTWDVYPRGHVVTMQTMSPLRRCFSAAGTLDLGTYQIPLRESCPSMRASSETSDGFARSCLLLRQKSPTFLSARA